MYFCLCYTFCSASLIVHYPFVSILLVHPLYRQSFAAFLVSQLSFCFVILDLCSSYSKAFSKDRLIQYTRQVVINYCQSWAVSQVRRYCFLDESMGQTSSHSSVGSFIFIFSACHSTVLLPIPPALLPGSSPQPTTITITTTQINNQAKP